ncbi:MAG: TAT-variant-translocated molybdopterin oxidoreductase [Oscillochloridaceae bacterium umkhey_bin13]
MTSTTPDPELEAVRERLNRTRGKQFWRSLDELADTPAFRELVEREFPRGASEMVDPVSRRTFLKLMGASLALAGVAGCTYMPREQIAPFDRQPLNRVPGIPNFFASAVTLNGYATGVLVRSNDGRPTKIEGNPLHPASLGATDLFAQGDILNMYDPDRSQTVLNNGAASSWADFTATLANSLTAQNVAQGAGMRILTTTVTSPTLASQLAELQTRFPQARWYQYEPINRDNVYEGARLAFGEDVATRYDFSRANVVLSLDADFLAPSPGFTAYARAFADGRRVTKKSTAMNRLYVVEPSPSTTGATADHRLPLRAGAVGAFAAALASRLGINTTTDTSTLSPEANEFLAAVLADLQANQGQSIVMAGDQQPPAVHALAHAINAALGNVGQSVIYTEPVEARPTNQVSEIANLVNEINAGTVELLVILNGNPAYNAPGDLRFADAVLRVPLVVHYGLYVDETARLASWHVPATHSLEHWSDARAFDGTVSLVQPLIEPLYAGKSEHELLAALLGTPDAQGYDLVRAYWEANGAVNGDGFEAFWQTSLANGLIAGSAAPLISPSLDSGAISGLNVPVLLSGSEVVFRPDPSAWDGFYTNNGWLMELPRPLNKLVWDNAALMSPKMAARLLGLPNIDLLQNEDTFTRELALEKLTAANGTVIKINYRGGTMELPLWLTPGHVDDSVTVTLGYGRTAAGRVGDGVGVNVYPLRTSDAQWFGDGAQILNGNRRYQLVSTQNHWTLEGRDIYRVGVFQRFKEDPKYIAKRVYREEYGKDTPGPGTDGYLSILPGKSYEGRNAWGMTINLNACIGCNACVAACQAENNIPIVGKDQVAVGREMHWLRIDRYFAGNNLDNPSTFLQPLGCVQCEQAPCELVCPVAATVHDYEGLNNMVYNRCVGTKYCSNNCPYKVRRFNFFQYTDIETASLQLQRNPEVTVRNRGVMEKCSYCVQRISDARISAKKAAVQAGQSAYTIADGAIVTACEAVCPTQAIVFGDINDESSRVAKWKAESHNYGFIGLLNTIPRTTYLARVRNPNEELEDLDHEAEG